MIPLWSNRLLRIQRKPKNNRTASSDVTSWLSCIVGNVGTIFLEEALDNARQGDRLPTMQLSDINGDNLWDYIQSCWNSRTT